MRARVWGVIGIAVVTLVLSTPAMAQQARIRGQITKVDGSELSVKTREGDDVVVRLADNADVAVIVKASLADIKTTSYVGAAAMPLKDGTVKALEVHIFPPAMRGVGEGAHDFDLEPGSTMINATVSGTVTGSGGQTLTLTYPEGSKTVIVPPGTPIVTFVPGTLADVKPGVGIIIFGADKTADGSVTAKRITVGRDGVNPPM
jgi:hypothetical protein